MIVAGGGVKLSVFSQATMDTVASPNRTQSTRDRKVELVTCLRLDLFPVIRCSSHNRFVTCAICRAAIKYSISRTSRQSGRSLAPQSHGSHGTGVGREAFEAFTINGEPLPSQFVTPSHPFRATAPRRMRTGKRIVGDSVDHPTGIGSANAFDAYTRWLHLLMLHLRFLKIAYHNLRIQVYQGQTLSGCPPMLRSGVVSIFGIASHRVFTPD